MTFICFDHAHKHELIAIFKKFLYFFLSFFSICQQKNVYLFIRYDLNLFILLLSFSHSLFIYFFSYSFLSISSFLRFFMWRIVMIQLASGGYKLFFAIQQKHFSFLSPLSHFHSFLLWHSQYFKTSFLGSKENGVWRS